jgi:hypothetical protein
MTGIFEVLPDKEVTRSVLPVLSDKRIIVLHNINLKIFRTE